MKNIFFFGFRLTFIGLWSIEVFGQKLATFRRLYVADEKMPRSCNFHRLLADVWPTEVIVVISVGYGQPTKIIDFNFLYIRK
jgi:hypothetical protein